MSACKGGHLDVVKYVCEIGGKELIMATDMVRVWMEYCGCVCKRWFCALKLCLLLMYAISYRQIRCLTTLTS